VGKQIDVKPKLLILSMLLLSALHTQASAGGLTAGLLNSSKGFGLSIDYVASDIIYNSYNVYADIYGMISGRYSTPGIKAYYLHYNRLASFSYKEASCGLFLGPGASIGYVRDMGSEDFGTMLSADIALSLRVSFKRNIDLEFGTVAELGFHAINTANGVQMGIYNNGLLQALQPTLKIMARF